MPPATDAESIPRPEAIAATAAVILRSGPGLTREASCFLATLSARTLIDGLTTAGLVLAQRDTDALGLAPPGQGRLPLESK